MGMDIYGYSERGAMNALFYGMAHDGEQGIKAMKTFITELAKIQGSFSDFTIYSEFSLSDFGDPDMIVTAKDSNNRDVVFFIEAKVSCGGDYKLSQQLSRHKSDMKREENKNIDSSNLFFQLRLKQYFVHRLKRGTLQDTKKDNSGFPEWLIRLAKRGGNSGENLRYIGNNVVVNRIANDLGGETIDEENVYYIAIIPKQSPEIKIKEIIEDEEIKDLHVHVTTWEDIYVNKQLKKYVKKTIEYNEVDSIKQIRNNPKHV